MTVKPVREGFHTITPYLMVREAAQLVDFVKQAFDATELFRTTGSAGGLHVEVRIGDSMVMIGGGGTWNGEPMPAAIYLYMDGVDTVYKRALQAGATSISEPADQPYGDRLAGVKDSFGNVWYISTHMQDIPME
jgi:PhnB protein